MKRKTAAEAVNIKTGQTAEAAGVVRPHPDRARHTCFWVGRPDRILLLVLVLFKAGNKKKKGAPQS